MTAAPLRNNTRTASGWLKPVIGLGFYAYHLAVHHFTPQGGRRRMCSCRAPHSAQGNFVVARWSLLSLHHPLRAFEEICMLDHLSGGSVEMGIGRGSLPIKLGHFGIDADDVPERYLEASEILMAAMKGGTLFYRGHHFPLDNVPLALMPRQGPYPPTWIATNRTEAARWATTHGANIASVGPAAFVREITEPYRAVEGCNTGTGTGTASKPSFVGLLRMIVVGQSASHAYSLAAPAFGRWLRNFRYLYDLNSIQVSSNLPRTFDAAVESELCVAGTAAFIRRTPLDQLQEAAANPNRVSVIALGQAILKGDLFSTAAFRNHQRFF